MNCHSGCELRRGLCQVGAQCQAVLCKAQTHLWRPPGCMQLYVVHFSAPRLQAMTPSSEVAQGVTLQHLTCWPG